MFLLIASLGILTACDDGLAPSPGEARRFTFSFDDGLDGWTGGHADGGAPAAQVEATQRQAFSGDGAAELTLDATEEGTGTVWMQREMVLEPNVSYEVRMHYQFGTEDATEDDVPAWDLLTGVATPPIGPDDLVRHGTTGHDQLEAFQWLAKEATHQATTGADGMLAVALGVRATTPSVRAYLLDEVDLTFTPVAPSSDTSSTE